MIMDIKTQLTNYLESIEKVLAKGDRVEIIPVKDGVKVLGIKRKALSVTDHTISDTADDNAT
jgi:hypothetical protein